ncbi:MAG: T9SS type A sorting domain-containing protein [Bacteroidia bacterium]|nr:T9SS type A sorting domain-containing protein [Bacteroidia bacterium]
MNKQTVTINLILKNILTLSIIFTIIFNCNNTFAQNAGSPDLTFAGTGYVSTSIGTVNSMSYGLVVQNDGKTITAGNSVFNGYSAITLVRYLTNGSLDNSFGNNGTVITQTGISSSASSIVLQNDNKIIAVGRTLINDTTFNFTAIRYNTDGTIDNTFGTAGIAFINVENSAQAYNIAIQTTGKIIISGYSNFNSNTGISLVRLNANGTPDNSFGTSGISIHHFAESPDVEAWAMALDANDNIITTGMITDEILGRNKIAVVKFNSDGSLDTGFGTSGITKTSLSNTTDDFGNAIDIQTDGKIVIAGTSNNTAVIARYNVNGSLDSSFGTGGIIQTNFDIAQPAEAYGITVQTDGKIVAVGVSGPNAQNTNGNFGLLRLNNDGTFDNTFGNNGKAITDISNGYNDVAFCVKEHTDGKLIVSGISRENNHYTFAAARYNGTALQIAENLSDENIMIFPNPVTDQFEITGLETGIIEIINTHGHIVNTISTTSLKHTINISEFNEGIYAIRITTKNGIIVKKLIKNN